MKMMVLSVVLISGVGMPALAAADEKNDVRIQLMTLIKELQYVRSLISEYKEHSQEGERYLFRYDVLDSRIVELVEGIEKHISAANQEERFYRLLKN